MNRILEYTESQSLRNRRIIESYFKAWKYHDISLIQRIFDSEASYRIIKQVPRRYIGRKHIIDYWVRNKNRQSDIRIKYEIKSASPTIIHANFKAYFFDSEENQYQSISGSIEFKIKNNLIVSLKEYYKKQILSTCHQNKTSGKKLYESGQKQKILFQRAV